MMAKPVRNLAASVRQRLHNNALATGRPFQEVFQYFAMERFLYRLSQSPHADKFVLKGALMFSVWHAPSTRPTKDIDLLGRMHNSVDAVVAVIRDICNHEVEPDGLVFDAAALDGRAIKEDADYEGVRVVFPCRLQNARVQMQIDIGFGDVVVPGPTMTSYPTMLDLAAPRLYGYNRETVVAEKFEAMVKLGQLNSRMKDFYDLWTLAREFEFAGPVLCQALRATFEKRQTKLPSTIPTGLAPAFAADPTKQTQWDAFLKRSRVTSPGTDIADVVQVLGEFLLPPMYALANSQPFDQYWAPKGPWKPIA